MRRVVVGAVVVIAAVLLSVGAASAQTAVEIQAPEDVAREVRTGPLARDGGSSMVPLLSVVASLGLLGGTLARISVRRGVTLPAFARRRVLRTREVIVLGAETPEVVGVAAAGIRTH